MKRHHVKPDFCDYSVTFTPDICALCLPCKIPCTVLGTQPKRVTHSTIVDGISISTVSLGEFCEDLQSDDLSEVILFWPKDASQIRFLEEVM
jgi:hypothetical protein